MTSILQLPLTGIIPPMVTPLLDNSTLDVSGLEHLIEHILNGGAHGLFILGTTGEAPSLSYKLRHELIERTTRQVSGRVPVLVGITDTSYNESLKMAEFAAGHNVSAVVLAPPYYYPPAQPELIKYIEHLVANLPLPLFLYNMPSFTKVSFEPNTVAHLSQIEGIVGLKDSSSNMVYFNTIKSKLQNNSEFSLLIGPDELLGEAVIMGAQGGICSGANIFPRLYVELYYAASELNIQKVKILHNIAMQISTNIYGLGQYESRVVKGIKCALALLNICSDFMAEPFSCFQEEEKRKMELLLKHIRHQLNTNLTNSG